MLFKENQLEIIDCGLFVPYSCSWRMNFYEIMSLVVKGYTYHIHQRVNLHNFSRDDAPFTENKGTGPAGEGVLLKITVEVCSMLPERLTLPQTKIRDLPCLTSAFRRRRLTTELLTNQFFIDWCTEVMAVAFLKFFISHELGSTM